MSTLTQGTQLFYQSSPTVMTPVGQITGVTGTGGARSQIDNTNLDDTEMQYIPGLAQPGAVSVPLNFDASNLAHRALFDLFTAGTKLTWVIGLSDGAAPPTSVGGTITYPDTRTFFSFTGFITDFPIDAALNSKLETTMTVQRSGAKVPHWKAVS